MKKRVNIMLSEEALEIADKSGNRSDYIEGLILGNSERPLEVVPLHTLQALLEAEFEKIKSAPKLEAVIPAAMPVMEKACCLAASPCAHWSFNSGDGVWVNSLSGKTREG
jgi:hypothetical protein